MLECLSRMPLSACQFSVTTFSGYFDTILAYELSAATWSEVVANVAPADGPVLVKCKEDATYFVPCCLRAAPYIGKTREKAIHEGRFSLEGKQRSAAHCTASAILKYDLDSMTGEQWAAVLEKLNASGLTFLAYSTWSYGLAEKPGVRVRVLIPMDVALDQADYELAWWGAAELLFTNLTVPHEKILESSAAKIHQQQGVWSTAPEREHLAFRIHAKGGVASAAALIAIGKVQHSAPVPRMSSAWTSLNAELSLPPDIARLTAAHEWIPADDYEMWIKTGHADNALTSVIGEDAAFGLWHAYSERGSNKSKNDGAAYSPESKWQTFASAMTSDAALGTLFALARDGARVELESDRGKPTLSDRGRAAAKYLATHHRALFNQLRGQHGQHC